MNYSGTLQWSKRLFKFFVKSKSLSCIKSYGKCIYINEKCTTKKLLTSSICHPVKLRVRLYEQRSSFKDSTKTHDVLKYNSFSQSICNSVKASTLGGIHNDGPLTKMQADDLILRLTEDERKALLNALQEYNSNQIKAEYEGQLAATRWRSKFGRPSKLPTLGDVDPTGSYCQLSEDWLKKKYGKFKYRTPARVEYAAENMETEKVPVPTGQQLLRIGIFNAVPFVGFGFLDNFVMIVAGDYIDETLGSLVTISTMAAAALGNTISDVMGIGSAWYVELAASKVGLKPPNLSPVQLDMKPARRAANLGRAMGIIVGCLLGMLPLLFISKEEVKKKEKA